MGSGEAKKFRAQFGSAGRHGDSFWAEESSNVGLKLLQGMGWEAGQGLGKHNEGSISHIKQTRKQDNRGIGATAATRDEAFKASQDLFNGVLARLNGKADEGEPDGAGGLGGAATTVKGAIAKRQLVHRFRRAKDTAGASADDLAAIFGRKPDAPACGAISACAPGAVHVNPPPEQRTSNVSLHDYFARKRLELGLAPLAAAGASAGFSLDDQAMFAEIQVAASYSGRAGLGMGARSGMGAQREARPQKRYTDASWTDSTAAVPTHATLAARADADGARALCGASVIAASQAEPSTAQAAPSAAQAGSAGDAGLSKGERKAARKEARKAERKAARKAAKRAGAAAEADQVGGADAAEISSKKRRREDVEAGEGVVCEGKVKKGKVRGADTAKEDKGREGGGGKMTKKVKLRE
jgi:hypothetical protein